MAVAADSAHSGQDRRSSTHGGGSPPATTQTAGLAEVVRQKEEMIHCLQDELIKERLREAENEERIRNLTQKVTDLEQETRRLREIVPENEVASLQEELAAAKLREAEANLALKELRAKVAELSAMWQKHLRRGSQQHQLQQQQQPQTSTTTAVQQPQDAAEDEGSNMEPPKDPPGAIPASVAAQVAPSTPKKLLGQLLGGGDAVLRQEASRLEEELMTIRVKEVDAQAELKERGLRVMELETQVS